MIDFYQSPARSGVQAGFDKNRAPKIFPLFSWNKLRNAPKMPQGLKQPKTVTGHQYENRKIDNVKKISDTHITPAHLVSGLTSRQEFYRDQIDTPRACFFMSHA
jgi:hypothetical protein